jgi:hypothetical protein
MPALRNAFQFSLLKKTAAIGKKVRYYSDHPSISVSVQFIVFPVHLLQIHFGINSIVHAIDYALNWVERFWFNDAT